MAKKRIVVLGAFALVALTIGIFAASGTEAVGTYRPTNIYTITTNTAGVPSNNTLTVTIPAPDYNYEDSSMYNFAPVAWKAEQGDAPPIGAWMGNLSSTSTLGLLNSACNQSISPTFDLYNASLDTGAQLTKAEMAWTNTATPPPDVNPANGKPDYLDKYPHFLNLMLDPDGPCDPTATGNPALCEKTDPGWQIPLEPKARYAGHTMVSTSYMLIEIVILSPDQIAQLPSIKAQMSGKLGGAILTVLNNPVDQVEAPGAVSDFCTYLQSTTLLYGTTKAGGAYGVAGGLPSQINPADNTGILATDTHLTRTYSQSERDVDGDGWENDMDPCEYTPDPTWDPRANCTGFPATKPGDFDCDGLPDSCDPAPRTFNDDQDGDGYNNQQDICPQVADGPSVPGSGNQDDNDSLIENGDKGPKPDSISDPCDDSDDDGNEDGAGVGTCNDGFDNNCRDADDEDLDSYINDGCPPSALYGESEAANPCDLPGATANCGKAAACAITNAVDDDADTTVNDGCPKFGATADADGADGNDPDCIASAGNGWTGMDRSEIVHWGSTSTSVWGTNPGTGLYFHAMPWAAVCVADADSDVGGGDGYCDNLETLLGSDPLDKTSTPESLAIDDPIHGVGANVKPEEDVRASCTDTVDNDKDGLTDANDPGCNVAAPIAPTLPGPGTPYPPVGPVQKEIKCIRIGHLRSTDGANHNGWFQVGAALPDQPFPCDPLGPEPIPAPANPEFIHNLPMDDMDWSQLPVGIDKTVTLAGTASGPTGVACLVGTDSNTPGAGPAVVGPLNEWEPEGYSTQPVPMLAVLQFSIGLPPGANACDYILTVQKVAKPGQGPLIPPNVTDDVTGMACADPDNDRVFTNCPGKPVDNCPTVWNPEQTNTDGDAQGDVCDTDDDADGYTDVIEWYLGTDPSDACPDGPAGTRSDAWALDQDRNKTITVVGDVLKFSGKIGASVIATPPTSWSNRRLDLDGNGTITVVGDVLKYSGKIGSSCT
jgi:hypothetical protein